MDTAIEETMSCQEVVELVTDYLENALLPKMRKLLEEHVAECPGCTSYIKQIQLTINLLRQLSQEPAFPATKQELMKIFQQWKEQEDER
jgi:predicted anti-sigma-YlaC factor YlaD